MKRIIKKIAYFLSALLVLVISVILISHIQVEKHAEDRVYDDADKIPKNKVGLLLGTSKYLVGGDENLYFKYRIEAAAELFRAGKIDYIIVSGDNRTKEYDEPSAMKKDLVKKGVPEDRIYSDYAGLRTLDSVVRSREVFGQDSITVISQPFHVNRALYIAKYKNIEAVGYNAGDVSTYYGFKTQLRERFARVKMFLDLIAGKEPEFRGEMIEIGE